MIKVLLKCKCTDGERSLLIRGRVDGEDISGYMKVLQHEVGKWHSHRHCAETKLEYMRIPLVDGKSIGEV